MKKRSNVVAARRIDAAQISVKKRQKKESKTARKRRKREKIQFLFFACLFVPAAMFGAELSLMKHPGVSRGSIQSVDLVKHELLLSSSQRSEPFIVTWLDTTEFFVEGTRAEADKLAPGMKATVWTKESLVFSDKVLKISASAPKPAATNEK